MPKDLISIIYEYSLLNYSGPTSSWIVYRPPFEILAGNLNPILTNQGRLMLSGEVNDDDDFENRFFERHGLIEEGRVISAVFTYGPVTVCPACENHILIDDEGQHQAQLSDSTNRDQVLLRSDCFPGSFACYYQPHIRDETDCVSCDRRFLGTVKCCCSKAHPNLQKLAQASKARYILVYSHDSDWKLEFLISGPEHASLLSSRDHPPWKIPEQGRMLQWTEELDLAVIRYGHDSKLGYELELVHIVVDYTLKTLQFETVRVNDDKNETNIAIHVWQGQAWCLRYNTSTKIMQLHYFRWVTEDSFRCVSTLTLDGESPPDERWIGSFVQSEHIVPLPRLGGFMRLQMDYEDAAFHVASLWLPHRYHHNT